MKIWILDCDVDKYENLIWDNPILDEIHSFDGREKLKDWNQTSVRRMYNREFSNSLGLSPHIPVFDRDALNSVEDLLEGNAEILPLACKEGQFYAINVTKVIDCVDYSKSLYKTFRDGKRIMRFIKYAFKPDEIKGMHLFKIVDEPLKRPFVSDIFRKRVMDSGLTGFIFELAWDSEVE